MLIEMIADYQCVTGEGPLWHPRENRLYWADIPEGKIYRYDPATGRHELFFSGDVIGGFTIQADGSLLLFMDRCAIALLRNGKLDYLYRELPGDEGTRFNDVIANWSCSSRVKENFCAQSSAKVPMRRPLSYASSRPS